MTRVYLPTFAELLDRLTIVQLKEIFIPDHKDEYRKEMSLILQDIDAIIREKNFCLMSDEIRNIIILAISNRVIWESESKARAGGNEQDKLLKYTHSINGIRSTAKNILSKNAGDRLDYKIDALAADLPEEFGNWRLWE